MAATQQDPSEEAKVCADAVVQAEDAVEAVSIQATALQEAAEFGADTEFIEQILSELNASGGQAQPAVTEARKLLNSALKTARSHPPDTKRKQVEDLMLLQDRITDAQKKLKSFKDLMQSSKRKLATAAILQKVREQLATAETEVEALVYQFDTDDQQQVSATRLDMSEKSCTAAREELRRIDGVVKEKLQGASGELKAELGLLLERVMEAEKRLETTGAAMKAQRDGLAAASLYTEVQEVVEGAEEALLHGTDVELLALRELEGSARKDILEAVAACDTAAAAAEAAERKARSVINSKLVEAKGFAASVADSTSEELNGFLDRVNKITGKLVELRQEIAERKANALLMDIVELVSLAESRADSLQDVGLPSADSLEMDAAEAKEEYLHPLLRQSASDESEADSACSEAGRALSAKRAEMLKGVPSSSPLCVAFSKLNARLETASRILTDHRGAVQAVKQFMQERLFLQQEEEKFKKLEQEVSSAEAELKLVAENAAGDDSAKFNEQCEKLQVTVISKLQDLKELFEPLHSRTAQAKPAFISTFQRLVEGAEEQQRRLVEINAKVKEELQRSESKSLGAEALKAVTEAEEAMDHAGVVQLPYLTGEEICLRKDAQEVVLKLESAAKAVQMVVNVASAVLESSRQKARQLVDSLSGQLQTELTALSERVESVAQRLRVFSSETSTQKLSVVSQTLQSKLSEAESTVAKILQEIAPLSVDTDNVLDVESALGACDKAADIEKEACEKMNELNEVLVQWKEISHTSELDKEKSLEMQQKAVHISAEFSLVKKKMCELEHKYVAKSLELKGSHMLELVETDMSQAKEAAKPLLVDSGAELLAERNALLVAGAIREHMRQSASTAQAVFEEICAGEKLSGLLTDYKEDSSIITEKAFLAYLEKLPRLVTGFEIEYSEAQRGEVCKCLLAHAEGGGCQFEHFQRFLWDRLHCVRGISLTDRLDLREGKTIAKLNIGDELEGLGEPQVEDATKLTRMECQTVEGRQRGWVTLKGNQGTEFVQPLEPLQKCLRKTAHGLKSTSKSFGKASKFHRRRCAELAKCLQGGPLAALGTELHKSAKARLSTVQLELQSLVDALPKAQKEYAARVTMEASLQQERQESKAAEAVMEKLRPVVERFSALEAEVRMEEGATAIITVQGKQLDEFAAPLTVQRTAGSKFSKLTKTFEDMMQSIAECELKLPATTREGPVQKVGLEVQQVRSRLEQAISRCRSLLHDVGRKLATIIKARFPEVSSALRKEIQKKRVRSSTLFEELADATQEISEEAFCGYLEKLPGLEIPLEQLQLLFQHIGAGGRLNRCHFLTLCEEYIECKTGVTLSIESESDNGGAVKFRTMAAGEVFHVLQKEHEHLLAQLTTIHHLRGKALKDGAEGWVNVRHSNFSESFKDIPKPFYTCKSGASLEKEAKSSPELPKRTLALGELLELLEGPSVEVLTPAIHARGKAEKDGATGWFVVKDNEGVVHAEVNNSCYECVKPVAMTEHESIKDGKTLRKMQVGDSFTLLEGPTKQPNGITRAKGKMTGGSDIGWVTIQGNAGTMYASQSSMQYKILKDVTLQKQAGESEVVRKLEKDELIDLMVEPCEEKLEPVLWANVRVLSDNSCGWVRFSALDVYQALPNVPEIYSPPPKEVPDKEEAAKPDVQSTEEVAKLDARLMEKSPSDQAKPAEPAPKEEDRVEAKPCEVDPTEEGRPADKTLEEEAGTTAEASKEEAKATEEAVSDQSKPVEQEGEQKRLAVEQAAEQATKAEQQRLADELSAKEAQAAEAARDAAEKAAPLAPEVAASEAEQQRLANKSAAEEAAAKAELQRLADELAPKEAQEKEAARVAAEKVAQEKEAATAAAGKEAQEQEAARAAAEKEAQENEAARVAAEKEEQEKEAAKVAADKEAQEKEAARAAAGKEAQEKEAARATAEKEAQEKEAARIAAEKEAQQQGAARAAAEKEAQEQEAARLAAEKEAQEKEAARVAAEKEAQENEAARDAAEKEAQEKEAARVAAEKAAQEKEGARVAAEKAAQEQEVARVAAEKEAQEKEAVRAAAGKETQEKEAARVAAEKEAQEKEFARVAAEKAAQEKEAARDAAEKAAQEQEVARAAAEKEAQEKEAARVAAEKEVQEKEAARAAAEKKAQEQEVARLAAEKEAQEKEAARAAAEKEAQEKEAARAAAEKEAKEKEAAKVAAEKEAQEKEATTVVAEKEAQEQQAARAVAEKETQEKEAARAAAEKEAQEKEAARAAAEKEAKEKEAAKVAAEKEAQQKEAARAASEEAEQKRLADERAGQEAAAMAEQKRLADEQSAKGAQGKEAARADAEARDTEVARLATEASSSEAPREKSKPPEINAKDIPSMKVVELKEACKSYGLKVGGTKEELVGRLQGHLKSA